MFKTFTNRGKVYAAEQKIENLKIFFLKYR